MIVLSQREQRIHDHHAGGHRERVAIGEDGRVVHPVSYRASASQAASDSLVRVVLGSYEDHIHRRLREALILSGYRVGNVPAAVRTVTSTGCRVREQRWPTGAVQARRPGTHDGPGSAVMAVRRPRARCEDTDTHTVALMTAHRIRGVRAGLVLGCVRAFGGVPVITGLVNGCLRCADSIVRFGSDVWWGLRRFCGGPWVSVLVILYGVGGAIWLGFGCPGPPAAVVVGAAGYVLLMVGCWAERRSLRRRVQAAGIDEVVEQETADLDGRWRDIHADASWVWAGRRENG